MPTRTNASKIQTHKRFLVSLEDAKTAFRIIFTDYDESTLTEGIVLWLSKMKNPLCLQLFLSLAELMDDYNFEDLLKGQIEVPEIADKQSFRIVGIAAGLFCLINNCWMLFWEKIHNDPSCDWPQSKPTAFDWEITKEILKTISAEEIQFEFFSSLLSIVGKPYYDLFIQELKVIDKKMDIQQVKAFENMPELKEHMQLMFWATVIRVFLDAVYFYFGEKNNS